MRTSKMIQKINNMDEVMVQVESDEITYVHIQDSSEGGYDYTFFDEYGDEIDGGIYYPDNFTTQMGEALIHILEEETERKYRIVKILSENKMEEIFENEYRHIFG